MTQSPTRVTAFVQYGVKLTGVVYVALGVIGFLPFDFINPMHAEGVGARYLINLVAINGLHNVIHLAIGLPALWAAKTFVNAQRWGKIAGGVLLVLFIVGMIQSGLEGFPMDQSFLGLVPLNSPGHILHFTSGALLLYLGLIKAER